MSRLPPPPRFNLPPPPMLPADFIDIQTISQLTCSSIRQHRPETIINSRLILFAGFTVTVAVLLLLTTLVWLWLSSRQQKQRSHGKPKAVQPSHTIDSMSNLSTCSSRSYETVSFDHTGIYLESVDTSATTCSTDVTAEIHTVSYEPYAFPPAPYYHVLNMPDVVPT